MWRGGRPLYEYRRMADYRTMGPHGPKRRAALILRTPLDKKNYRDDKTLGIQSMKSISRFANILVIVLVLSAGMTTNSLSADRSNAHALALSHRYGAYTRPGNLAAGQTVVIDPPEGAITCSGG